jgi:tetratricopeptide (TPR) repeat protein
MHWKTWIVVALLAPLWVGSMAWAEPAAELLEKGLYTEETVGDLEAAIEIYEQIIADAQANRSFVAQAQLRLGICYLKSGREEEATAALEKLIKDFPDQKDLVAIARENLPDGPDEIVLGPEPWVDGEALKLVLRLPAGLRVGTCIWSAESTTVAGKEAWHLEVRKYFASGQNAQGLTWIDAPADTFRPVAGVRKSTILGDFEAVFKPGVVEVTSKGAGKDTVDRVEIDQPVYENDQFMWVARRLPLEVGYKTSLQLFPLVVKRVIYPRLEVTAKEKVTVPAGTFECYKVEFAVDAPPFPPSQTYWFSADPNRYLVKFEAGGTIGELTEIMHRKPGKPALYENEEFDFSLTAPEGWFFYEHDSRGTPDVMIVLMLDPQAEIRQAVVEVVKKPAPIDHASIPELAEDQLKGIKTFLKDYKLRGDRWVEGEIAGIPTVSFIGDYKEGDRKMVEYRIYLLGAKVEKHVATFVFKTSADQFERYHDAFDGIVGSYRAE